MVINPKKTISELVHEAAESILAGHNDSNPMSVKDLMQRLAARAEIKIKPYKVYEILTQLSQDNQSQIASRKGKGGGYFLTSPVSDEVQEVTPTVVEEVVNKTLEKHIWPLAASWLKRNKQIDQVNFKVANQKGGGIWSNPDIVGLNIIKELGLSDVEIITMEVKPDLSQWQYYFFEAVSHKRFSERSYFVFRSSGSGKSDLPELLRYAEKYKVGLVNMELDDIEYKSLVQWPKLADEDKAALLEKLYEVMPAPFEPVSAKEKVSFLRQLGISKETELTSFGQKSELY